MEFPKRWKQSYYILYLTVTYIKKKNNLIYDNKKLTFVFGFDPGTNRVQQIF